MRMHRNPLIITPILGNNQHTPEFSIILADNLSIRSSVNLFSENIVNYIYLDNELVDKFTTKNFKDKMNIY